MLGTACAAVYNSDILAGCSKRRGVVEMVGSGRESFD